jgi:hypothetical protein
MYSRDGIPTQAMRSLSRSIGACDCGWDIMRIAAWRIRPLPLSRRVCYVFKNDSVPVSFADVCRREMLKRNRVETATAINKHVKKGGFP